VFYNPFYNAFGLDISDLSIKVVQLKGQGRYHKMLSYELMAARSISLPYGIIVNGELEQPEIVRKYLKYLITGNPNKGQKPIHSPWVLASLPETHNFIKQIIINKDPDEIIEEDIILTVKKHLPFEENNYYLDWQILPSEQKDQTIVLVGACPKTIADMYTYLLESVGLGVVGLEIESLAIARAMITASKEYINEARALLDIGATRTNLIIFDNNSVQFSKTLTFSGEIVNTALSQRLHISYEEAEKFKIQYGCEFDQKNKEVWHIIANLTNDLTKEIEQALNFYYSHFDNANKVTHITMCGGGAYTKRLDLVLSEKLNIEASSGKVWKNLHVRKAEKLPSGESLGYAAAIGLALRAANNPISKNVTL